MTVGERIRAYRERMGITQEELARKIGTRKQTIYKYENNIITNIPSDKIENIATALETTPVVLMGWLDIAEENKPTKEELTRFKANTYEALVVKEMQKMNKAGKVKLLDTARDMTCSPLYNPDYQVELKAAHERTDIEITDEMRKHDDDIMSDDDF